MQVAANPKNKRFAILNIVAFIIVIVTNWLAVILPLNGKTTGELSDAYPNKFTPAGFTFSIWGIIYLFLAGFVIYQAIVLLANKRFAERIRKITPLFIINCLANAAWLFAWHYQQVGLSVLIMLVMLITLILIHERLNLAWRWQPLTEKLLLDVPFSIYLGWISVATIANITTWFIALSIEPLGISSTMWTMIMLVVATMIGAFMAWRKDNVVFALVVCWALYGIIAKREQVGSIGSSKIILVAEICIGLLIIVILLQLAFSNRRKLTVTSRS
jgi:hypothetical protein